MEAVSRLRVVLSIGEESISSDVWRRERGTPMRLLLCSAAPFVPSSESFELERQQEWLDGLEEGDRRIEQERFVERFFIQIYDLDESSSGRRPRYIYRQTRRIISWAHEPWLGLGAIFVAEEEPNTSGLASREVLSDILATAERCERVLGEIEVGESWMDVSGIWSLLEDEVSRARGLDQVLSLLGPDALEEQDSITDELAGIRESMQQALLGLGKIYSLVERSGQSELVDEVELRRSVAEELATVFH